MRTSRPKKTCLYFFSESDFLVYSSISSSRIWYCCFAVGVATVSISSSDVSKKYKSKHPDVPYKRNHLLITDNCRIVLSCFGSRIFTMILTYNLYVQFSFFNDKAYINVKIKFGFCLLISEGFQKHYFYNQSSVFIYFSLTWTN